ncbi:MAG: hypothetical protein QXI39_06230 [Candidatus Bathyarchaeia archaeon]
MAWRGFGRRIPGWWSPWPVRGPFSYLPPWQRPGWLFGRGACWWLFNPFLRGMYGYPGYFPWIGYGTYGPIGFRMPYWTGWYGYYPPYGY